MFFAARIETNKLERQTCGLDHSRNIRSKEMAKKTRRTTTVSVTSSGSAARSEFNPDYTHVKRDLSRIGILAGSFFGLLIILSFFIK
jgi:hypothetical protein